MSAERGSDPKRSASARVASVARRQQRAQRAAEIAAPRSLQALAREIGATYSTGVQL